VCLAARYWAFGKRRWHATFAVPNFPWTFSSGPTVPIPRTLKVRLVLVTNCPAQSHAHSCWLLIPRTLSLDGMGNPGTEKNFSLLSFPSSPSPAFTAVFQSVSLSIFMFFSCSAESMWSESSISSPPPNWIVTHFLQPPNKLKPLFALLIARRITLVLPCHTPSDWHQVIAPAISRYFSDLDSMTPIFPLNLRTATGNSYLTSTILSSTCLQLFNVRLPPHPASNTLEIQLLG